MSHPCSRPSFLHLPAGSWRRVLDCLCDRFPAIAPEVWVARMQQGKVQDALGQPLGLEHPYQEGMRVQYFREVPDERPIPFEAQVLYADEYLVVADKPHFLPVQPSGQYVEQTLLARLSRQLGNPQLAPLHRIDRLTAGLVLFSANPEARGQYQALFRERRIHKLYEAIAPALPQHEFPLWRRTRLVDSEPFFLMRESDQGPANTETRIEVLEQQGDYWRYALYPVSGKRHQLRVHMAALGAGICNDPLYPQLWPRDEREAEDYQRPLKLLARQLDFIDPITGVARQFRSQLSLEWPQ